jgi:hypothetical protein
MLRQLMFALAAGSAIGLPSGASATPLPDVDQVLTAHERQIFTPAVQEEFSHALTRPKGNLPFLDGLLASDPEPTQFRGVLQMVRALSLLDESRISDAIAAIDESVRLLPGFSGPLMVAEDVYAYSDRPSEAADFFLRACELDPETARTIDDYDLSNLTLRLGWKNDDRRLGAVADKLLAIGWTGKLLGSRSNLAFEAIKRRVAGNDVEGARSLVPDLVVPKQTYTLLADKRYQQLWPDLERWAGPRLATQWQIYLTEARERFLASRSPEDAEVYAVALNSAGKDQAMIADLLPLYSAKLDPLEDQDLVFVATFVGDALARQGRWADLETLFGHAEAIWPLGASNANALNLSANHARFLLYKGDPQAGLAMMDRSLQEAKSFGGEVGTQALEKMNGYRACALKYVGRDSEARAALLPMPWTASPDSAVDVRLCVGDGTAARQTLLSALANEPTRAAAILLLQRESNGPFDSEFSRALWKRWEDLRNDPIVLSALQQYGRIMPFALNEGAASLHSPAVRGR